MGASKTKVSIESWTSLAQQEGYQMLSIKYIDSRTHLEFLCPKSHRWMCNWDNWKQGNRCRQCCFERPRKTKHTIESIKEHCTREGYQVLTKDYKNPHSYLRLICPQGHTYESMWMQFNRGERCRECRFEVMSIEKVRIALEKEGYVLVSTTYKNPHTKLESFCIQGHEHNFAWAEFKKGYRCLECAKHKTISKGEKKLGEIVRLLFSKEKVEYQDDLGFLGRQTVDYSVPTLDLAFEFDGEHHFKPTSYGGMSSDEAKQVFKVWQQRDARKNELCRIHKIKLIRIAYNETLTLESVREKIGSAQ